MQFNKEVCELKHKQNDREHEAMRELIKALHEGDERFLQREVSQITEKLKEIKSLEDRINKLERWRIYLLGAGAVLMALIPVAIRLTLHFTLGI